MAAHLDPSKPRAIMLLGERLVLWRAKDGAWQCFEDRCPHRLAPLSGALLWCNAVCWTCVWICCRVKVRCSGVTLGFTLDLCFQTLLFFGDGADILPNVKQVLTSISDILNAHWQLSA